MSDVEIIEFKSEYQDQVINLIGKILRQLKIIPQSEEPINDEDLHKIPKVYGGKGRFWIAIEKNNVIGTVAVKDMGQGTAKLKRMFVLFEYHGRGVGQQLFDKAIDFAKKQGFKEVVLNTHPLMKRAHHFYEKNGFKKVKENQNKLSYLLKLGYA